MMGQGDLWDWGELCENYKELIKQISVKDYRCNRINLHIHSTYSDGEATFEQIEEQAIKIKRYKCFSITDHNTVQGYLDYPDTKAIPGVEFDVWYKFIFLHCPFLSHLLHCLFPSHELTSLEHLSLKATIKIQ